MATNIYYLVRHAEKANLVDPDTSISQAGQQRAVALKDTLQSKNITNIIVSGFKRTQQTAAPLENSIHVPHTVMDKDDIAKIIQRLRQFSHSLVVGHTDNVPLIIKKITGRSVTIAEDDFDNLYIITVKTVLGNKTKKLTKTTYGLPSP